MAIMEKAALAAMVFAAVSGFVTFCSASEKNTENVKVVFETTMGNIVLELFPEKAPVSVENFLKYVDEGFYEGVIFHRVIPGFMAQGGGFDKEMNQKETHKPIKNEADNGLKNKRGTISYARTSDINSATSQFFLNVKDNGFLDHGARDFGYAVFGEIVAGMDVVDKIVAVKTTTVKGFQDVPVKPIVITKARRFDPKKDKDIK